MLWFRVTAAALFVCFSSWRLRRKLLCFLLTAASVDMLCRFPPCLFVSVGCLNFQGVWCQEKLGCFGLMVLILHTLGWCISARGEVGWIAGCCKMLWTAAGPAWRMKLRRSVTPNTWWKGFKMTVKRWSLLGDKVADIYFFLVEWSNAAFCWQTLLFLFNSTARYHN